MSAVTSRVFSSPEHFQLSPTQELPVAQPPARATNFQPLTAARSGPINWAAIILLVIVVASLFCPAVGAVAVAMRTRQIAGRNCDPKFLELVPAASTKFEKPIRTDLKDDLQAKGQMPWLDHEDFVTTPSPFAKTTAAKFAKQLGLPVERVAYVQNSVVFAMTKAKQVFFQGEVVSDGLWPQIFMGGFRGACSFQMPVQRLQPRDSKTAAGKRDLVPVKFDPWGDMGVGSRLPQITRMDFAFCDGVHVIITCDPVKTAAKMQEYSRWMVDSLAMDPVNATDLAHGDRLLYLHSTQLNPITNKYNSDVLLNVVSVEGSSWRLHQQLGAHLPTTRTFASQQELIDGAGLRSSTHTTKTETVVYLGLNDKRDPVVQNNGKSFAHMLVRGGTQTWLPVGVFRPRLAAIPEVNEDL